MIKTAFQTEPHPNTVEEAADRLISWMDGSEKSFWTDPEMLKMSAKTGLNPDGMLHFGLMMQARNDWKMHDPSTPLVANTRERFGVEHGDDVSGLIQELMLAKLRRQEFDLEARAARMRSHWARIERGGAHTIYVSPDTPMKPGWIGRVVDKLNLKAMLHGPASSR